MPEADLLTIIAEIALGLAGFAGVIAALGPRNRSWQILDRLRIIALLLNSFLVLIFALVPLGLAAAKIEESDIWIYSSTAYLLFLLHVPFKFRAIFSAARTYDGFKSFPIGYTILTVELSGAVLLLANVGIYKTAWPHIAALGIILITGFFIFAELLVILVSEKREQNDGAT
ncbi:MAG: hypothetical protein ACU85U_04475 [Gammaproteobacteria bacterium]